MSDKFVCQNGCTVLLDKAATCIAELEAEVASYKRLLSGYNEQIVQQEISELTESQSAGCKPGQQQS